MTGSPLPTAPLSVLQGQGNIWRVRQSACNEEGCRIQTPSSVIHRDSPPPRHALYSLWKQSWLHRTFGAGLGTWVCFLPRLPTFLIKAASLLLILASWFVAFEWRAAKREFSNRLETRNRNIYEKILSNWILINTLKCQWKWELLSPVWLFVTPWTV